VNSPVAATRRWFDLPGTGFAFALALSLVIAVLVFGTTVGFHVVNPRSVSWLHSDMATHQLAWEFLRQEPVWTLPLTYSTRVAYPLGASLALFDNVPLVAVLLRPFSAMLPDSFQYLGPYLFLDYLLQALFGVLLAQRLASGNAWQVVLLGAFFTIAPPFIWRSLGHISLTSHWGIVAAVYLYLAPIGQPFKFRTLVPFLILLFLIGGVSPYISFMTLLTAIGFAGRMWLGGIALRYCALAVAAMLASVVVPMALIGFIDLRSMGAVTAWGFGVHSMNLASPIDPGPFASIALKQRSMLPGQGEGYAYLGLGVMMALIVSLARKPAAFRAVIFSRDFAPLWIASAIGLAMAVSTKVVLGSHVLMDPALPAPLYKALSIFRSSGRLSWLAHYTVLCIALLAVTRCFRGTSRLVVLALLLVIQAVDTQSLRSLVWDTQHTPAEPLPFKDPVWRTLGENNRHLMVLPAWQCNGYIAPGGFQSFRYFGLLAVEQKMTTNSYYSGRYSAAQERLACTEQPAQAAEGKFDDATAYVMSPAFFGRIKANADRQGHSCRPVDGFVLCTAAR
jgi:hypothetical protein